MNIFICYIYLVECESTDDCEEYASGLGLNCDEDNGYCTDSDGTCTEDSDCATVFGAYCDTVNSACTDGR